MAKYIKHLQELSNPKTFKRKKDYIDYNLKSVFKSVGYKNIKVLEIGPGLGEFESYLNDKKIFDIDIVDNDKSVLDYVSKNYRIKNKFLINKMSALDKKLGSYDVILLMQVLEHLPASEYAFTLKTLFEHLKTNGYLIIVVPNSNNPLGLVERYADLQHTGAFTTQSLKDLLNLAEIKNYQTEIRGYEIPPIGLLNIVRIFLQKILHFVLLLMMVVNGGLFFKTMTPNIMLIIRKNYFRI